MTIEVILAGESKNIEFKEALPERSIKYMKPVVAFANGSGGKIIFGISDKTREVVGFNKEDVFKKMDAIANAVSDSCEPAMIPDITLQTVDGKTIIVVEVSEGRQRPYYIKVLGREGGVYVRVAGTTHLADEYMIKELSSIKDVSRQQLRSWGILIEHWESGIPGIIGKVKVAGLREPEFIGGEVDLRINIYRGQIDGTVDLKALNNVDKMPDSAYEMPNTPEKVPNTIEKIPDSADEMPDTMEGLPENEQEQQIYKYGLENSSITTAKAMELLDVKQRRARTVLLNMVKSDYLRREGAARSTIYVKNTKEG